MMLEPTCSSAQAAMLVGRSDRWVRLIASRDGIGVIVRHSWRFTPSEVALLRSNADPSETRGRPPMSKVLPREPGRDADMSCVGEVQIAQL